MKPTKIYFWIIPCKESKAKLKLSQTQKFLQSHLQGDLQPSSQLKEISSSLHNLNRTNWKANIGELAKKLKSMTPPTPKPKQNSLADDSSNDSETKESNSSKITTMPKERKRQNTILESFQNSPKTKKSKPLTGNVQNKIFKYRAKKLDCDASPYVSKPMSHFIVAHTICHI